MRIADTQALGTYEELRRILQLGGHVLLFNLRIILNEEFSGF